MKKIYQLESNIRALKQNNMIIEEFYSIMNNLWDQLALMKSVGLKTIKAYTDQIEEKRLIQFPTALQDFFLSLHESILNRTPISNLI